MQKIIVKSQNHTERKSAMNDTDVKYSPDNLDKSKMSGNLYKKVQSDPDMKRCFDALPVTVQESLLMSAMDIDSIEQLRSVADKLLCKDNKSGK